ncbi:MAG: fibronectin type III-like domain-contianing protein, partial [Bacteroidetes bacterium]|nr:fibronectin type III-like domain-contianing protein [Bacteroidota bacterium]
LRPGETKTAEFMLTPYDLSFINTKMERVIESGDVDVMVGGNSEELIIKVVRIEKSMMINERGVVEQ